MIRRRFRSLFGLSLELTLEVLGVLGLALALVPLTSCMGVETTNGDGEIAEVSNLTVDEVGLMGMSVAGTQVLAFDSKYIPYIDSGDAWMTASNAEGDFSLMLPNADSIALYAFDSQNRSGRLLTKNQIVRLPSIPLNPSARLTARVTESLLTETRSEVYLVYLEGSPYYQRIERKELERFSELEFQFEYVPQGRYQMVVAALALDTAGSFKAVEIARKVVPVSGQEVRCLVRTVASGCD